ncbi:hypothetical protein BSZ19_02655 [Bradyrhizobium japonicum]|uniref:Uncharacterized protein n=1 Tax=Bradyrhizobium japonicum TaxID=375 RepID=A0A1Y2K013_BRAJP|nr:hypothetical protein BSZ19_02655 [Bradyrhizobium japonicum]
MGYMDTGLRIPESVATLAIQQAQLIAGKRNVQMFPNGQRNCRYLAVASVIRIYVGSFISGRTQYRLMRSKRSVRKGAKMNF